jgi:hypothetical protein
MIFELKAPIFSPKSIQKVRIFLKELGRNNEIKIKMAAIKRLILFIEECFINGFKTPKKAKTNAIINPKLRLFFESIDFDKLIFGISIYPLARE